MRETRKENSPSPQYLFDEIEMMKVTEKSKQEEEEEDEKEEEEEEGEEEKQQEKQAEMEKEEEEEDWNTPDEDNGTNDVDHLFKKDGYNTTMPSKIFTEERERGLEFEEFYQKFNNALQSDCDSIEIEYAVHDDVCSKDEQQNDDECNSSTTTTATTTTAQHPPPSLVVEEEVLPATSSTNVR